MNLIDLPSNSEYRQGQVENFLLQQQTLSNPFNVTSMWGIVSHIEKEFGISTAIGGFSAIAQAMGKVIRDMGGEIHLGTEIKHINVNKCFLILSCL